LVGGYPEGTLAEDLILFHLFLDIPGMVLLQSASYFQPLLIYRHHLSGLSLTSKTPRRLLLKIKIRALERRVLRHWPIFAIWGAGRDGHAFFQELDEEYRGRIVHYGDVDPSKIKTGFHDSGKILPIVHISQIFVPFVVCVAMGRTGGELEANIAKLGLEEGRDYWHFN